jgi:hypothetical protein
VGAPAEDQADERKWQLTIDNRLREIETTLWREDEEEDGEEEDGEASILTRLEAIESRLEDLEKRGFGKVGTILLVIVGYLVLQLL